MKNEFDDVSEYLKVSFKPCDDVLPVVNITDWTWDDDELVMEFATIEDRRMFEELWHNERPFRVVMDNTAPESV